MLVFPSMPKGEIVGSCCHWCQWFDYLGDCWIICHWCKWFGLIDVIGWCQVIDWYDSLDENGWRTHVQVETNRCKGKQMDELQSGPLMVKALMGRRFADWVILEEWLEDPFSHIVLSWLIRCINGWTPKWSPYGESPHGKTLYGLSYPRRMVGGPMLVWGIMRWRSRKLLVKLS